MSAALAGAADQYPLLLFSHGYHGFRTQSTFLMQELASHGYVVVAVEHPYAAMITVFPDGSIAEHNPDTLPSGVTQAVYDQAARKLADQWAGDLSFVLDSLENPSGPFAGLAGRLDYGRIGALGHSTGGGSAIEFCSRDVRCKAVLGLDAWLVPVSLPVIEQGLEQPVFLIYSELWPTAENLSLAQSLRDRSPQNGQITILGTDHYDFTDMPLLSPLAPQLGLKGPLDGTRTLQIINAYSIAFFDQVLRNQVSPLLQEPVQEYPEVRWDGGD
jgi:dienelactone hydrolase